MMMRLACLSSVGVWHVEVGCCTVHVYAHMHWVQQPSFTCPLSGCQLTVQHLPHGNILQEYFADEDSGSIRELKLCGCFAMVLQRIRRGYSRGASVQHPVVENNRPLTAAKYQYTIFTG